VEAVAKEAAAAALCKICHEAAMATLESVVREATKVDVRELRHDIMAREAMTRMYTADAATEEVIRRKHIYNF
jgi:hypothetical protein